MKRLPLKNPIYYYEQHSYNSNPNKAVNLRNPKLYNSVVKNDSLLQHKNIVN